VFEELGAEVVTIGAAPDGFNINRDVGSTKPEALASGCWRGADLGIAFDGDGDRLMMVDAGRAGRRRRCADLHHRQVAARHRTELRAGGRYADEQSRPGAGAAAPGRGFERTKVGDRYIMEQLKQTGGMLGGEPSGHIICRDRTSTGDGIVAALQVLAALSEQDLLAAEATAEVERYPQVLVNVRSSGAWTLDLPRCRRGEGAERPWAGRGGCCCARPAPSPWCGSWSRAWTRPRSSPRRAAGRRCVRDEVGA
jgi:phosphoglucosamine mutase